MATRRIVTGLGSLAVLLALLIGAPIALWTLGGMPWPDHLPGMTELMLGGWLDLLLSVVKLAGWIAWAVLAYAVIVETISVVRGVTITPPPGLSVAHGSARSLVLGVFLLGSLGSTATAMAAPGDATGPAATDDSRTPTVGSTDAAATSPRAQAPAEATLLAYESSATVTTTAGDTLWSLAEQHYGDGLQWTQIRDANPELASSPLLAIGQQIIIPPAPATDGQYTVQPGDCLWDIAATELGDGHRWTEIRDANPGAVHGASSIIYVGTHLSMPADTAASTQAAPAPTQQTPAPQQDNTPAPVPAPSSQDTTSSPAPSGTEPSKSSDESDQEKIDQPSRDIDDENTGSAEPDTTQDQQREPASGSDPAQEAEDKVAEILGGATSEDSKPHDQAPAPVDSPPLEDESAPADEGESAPTAPYEQSAPAEEPGQDEDLSRDLGAPEQVPTTGASPDDEQDGPAADPAQEAEDRVAEILGGATAEDGETQPAPTEADEPESADESASDDADETEPSTTVPTDEPAPADEPGQDEDLSRDLGTPEPTTTAEASPNDAADDAQGDPTTGGDPAEEVEDKVAGILGPLAATQQGDPPTGGIGDTSVAPQPEATDDEADDIQREAAAAAAGMLGPAPQAEQQVPTPPPPPPPPPPADTATNTIGGIDLAASDLKSPRSIGAVAGLSALALLGIVGAVAWRRSRQQHDRDRGRSIALPAEPATGVLDAMDAAADPVVLDDVAAVLRDLAAQTSRDGTALPTLVGVTLGQEQVGVALVDEVELTEPWELREGSWWVEPSALDTAEPAMASPWPTVVPIGSIDDEDFLLNLELVGHLAIRATDSDTARHIVQALAVELAVSPLSDEVQLHLVGVARDLPDAVASGRVHTVDSVDELIADLESTSKRHDRDLEADGIATINEARALYQTSDYTAPHVVLSVDPLTSEQRERIDELAAGPRWAFAAVTPAEHEAHAGWILDVDADSHADLHTGSGGGMEMEVKGLDDEALAAVVEVLASTHRPATTPAAHAPDADDAGDRARGGAPGGMEGLLTSPEPDHCGTGSEQAVEGDSDNSGDSAPAWAAEKVDSNLLDTHPAPVLVTAPKPHGASEEPATDTTVDDIVADFGHVWIRTLGVPQVDPATPGRIEANKVGLLTELAVMLHLTGGADHRRIDARLWPKDAYEKITDVSERRKKKNSRRQQALSRLRAWIGPANDGEDALPKVGDRSGNAIFRLHPEVRSDWDLFQRLLPDPTDLGTASDEALGMAVALITGPPLTAPRMATRYGWADDERQEMISRSADAIEELAARQIYDHQVTEALATAEFGLTVDQSREGLWRLAIICTHALDDDDSRQRTQELIDRMLAHMADLEVELEEETDTLLDSLKKLSDDDGQRLYDITAQAS